MCRAVKCKVCGKTTWAGCGNHIDSVKRSVPARDWCPGHPKEPKSAGEGGFMGTFKKIFGK